MFWEPLELCPPLWQLGKAPKAIIPRWKSVWMVRHGEKAPEGRAERGFFGNGEFRGAGMLPTPAPTLCLPRGEEIFEDAHPGLGLGNVLWDLR